MAGDVKVQTRTGEVSPDKKFPTLFLEIRNGVFALAGLLESSDLEFDFLR